MVCSSLTRKKAEISKAGFFSWVAELLKLRKKFDGVARATRPGLSARTIVGGLLALPVAKTPAPSDIVGDQGLTKVSRVLFPIRVAARRQ